MFFSSVSIVHFEQVNLSWVGECSLSVFIVDKKNTSPDNIFLFKVAIEKLGKGVKYVQGSQ